MNRRKKFVSIGLIVVMMFLSGINVPMIYQALHSPTSTINDLDEVGIFSNFEEIVNFLELKRNQPNNVYPYYPEPVFFSWMGDQPLGSSPAASFSSFAPSDGYNNPVTDYSTTNVQVDGVDEGDIVKTDGKYAYIVSGDKKNVSIITIYPSQQAEIVSKIEFNWTIKEIYLKGDKLVVLGSGIYYEQHDFENYYQYTCRQETYLSIYNVKTRESPILLKFYNVTGSFIASRLINNHFYLITSQPAMNLKIEGDLPAPANQIYYFTSSDYSFSFTSIMAVNIQDHTAKPKSFVILMGGSNDIYVSSENVYITRAKNRYYGNQLTQIHKISIQDGIIRYNTSGCVSGYLLNRYSMDEYQGYFRIATTQGQTSWGNNANLKNQIYVLNGNLSIIGSIENIAPGEKIYSARFMGARAYLVTFQKVDPFFVIDLNDPANPQLLGELKIPGYSNYLHPYDENHVIGIGKDCVEDGDVAWYQGVKVSLFDVTDVKNPQELSSYIIGDRGTSSPALYDPHAFLFSKSQDLLVLPISLSEINHTNYETPPPPYTYGTYTWQGAYVLNISSATGITLRGKITHEYDSSQSSSYYTCSPIMRSFYINDTLYTVSNTMIKGNALTDLSELICLEF